MTKFKTKMDAQVAARKKYGIYFNRLVTFHRINGGWVFKKKESN